MKKVNFTYPNGFKKAFTLSYDDGVYQDIRFIEIINKYNLKATFNLNSGVPAGTSWNCDGVDIVRMDLNKTVDLYKGHEIAIHSLTHPDLVKLSKEDIKKEILEDKINLEKIYNTEVSGMAYPFGTYDEDVINVIREIGVSYSRTVKDTEKFILPDNFLKWHPTCRHENPKLMTLAEEFLNSTSSDMSLFYVWGHSYEFDVNNNWNIIEDLAKYISNKDNVWYATNKEIYNYITALKSVEVLEDDKKIINKSNMDIYAEIDKNLILIPVGQTFEYN